MLIFFAWIGLSVIVALIGSDRVIGGLTAFFASVLLSPVIGLILVLASERKSDVEFKKAMMQKSGYILKTDSQKHLPVGWFVLLVLILLIIVLNTLFG